MLQLVAVIFFTVSGGPYGLEPLLKYAGDHMALCILLVTPFLWDVPAMLTVMELNSMMPITGGYYKWVKHALGTRWGFFEGLWTWFYTFVDLAIYPVLFVQYASFVFPGFEAYKVVTCLCVIWGLGLVNILGAVPVGKLSLMLGAVVLSPFVVAVVLFFYHHTGGYSLPAPSAKGLPFSSLSMALYTIMWNCLGWDNATTYAEEVDKPIRTYLVAMFIAFVLVLGVYFAITYVALQSHINHDALMKDGYPLLGQMLGGRWLGLLIAMGGMASALGLYAANLLSVSRLPQVMADDGLLPRFLGKLHPRFGTPYISIIICCAVISFMILWTFGDLLIIDVTVYGAGLFLEYFALIRLRIKEPDTPRPFRIPLGVGGLVLMIIVPICVYIVAVTGIFSSTKDAAMPAIFAIAIILAGPAIWAIMVWRNPALKNLPDKVKRPDKQ